MPDITIGIKVQGGQAAATELRQIGTAAKDAGEQTKTAGGNFASFGKNILGIVGGIGLMGNALFGITDAFDAVDKADLRASRSSRTVQEAIQKRDEIQKKLNSTLQGSSAIERENNGEVHLTEEAMKSMATTAQDGTKWIRDQNGQLQQLKATSGQTADLQSQLADANRDVSLALENQTFQTRQAQQAHQQLGLRIFSNVAQFAGGAFAVAEFARSMTSIGSSAGTAKLAIGGLGGALSGFGIALAVIMTAKGAIDAVLGAIHGFAAGAKQDFATASQGFNDMVHGVLEMPLLVGGPILQLLEQFHMLPRFSAQDAKQVVEAFNGIATAMGPIGAQIAGGIDFISKGFQVFVAQLQAGNISGALQTAFAGAQQIFNSIGTALENGLRALPGIIVAAAVGLANAFGQWVTGIPAWLAGGAAAVASAVGGWVSGVTGAIVSGAVGLANAFASWVLGIPAWLAGGAVAVGTAVAGWVVGVTGAIVSGAINLANAFASWVMGIPAWLAGGAIAVATAVSNWVVGVTGAIVSGAISLATAFASWVTGIPSWLAGGAAAVSTAVAGWITGVTGAIVSGVNSLATAFASWITGIPAWLAGGASAVTTAINGWVTGAGSAIIGAAANLAISFNALVSFIPGWLGGGAIAVTSAIGKWMSGAGAAVLAGAVDLAKAFLSLISFIPGWLGGGANAVKQAIEGWFTGATAPKIPLDADNSKAKQKGDDAKNYVERLKPTMPFAIDTQSAYQDINGIVNYVTTRRPTMTVNVVGRTSSGGTVAVASGFGPAMVTKPTLFLVGEAGPEMMSVVPMAKGTSKHNNEALLQHHDIIPMARGTRRGGILSGGNSESLDVAGLVTAVERLVSLMRSRGLEANLFVDGQRMATTAQKYIGSKSYGDR